MPAAGQTSVSEEDGTFRLGWPRGVETDRCQRTGEEKLKTPLNRRRCPWGVPSTLLLL